MGFNGIGAYTSQPGEIPWELVTAYFLIALGVVFLYGKKTGGLRRFSTLDLVYIAVGGALAVVWEFNVGALIRTPSFIDIGFLGRLFILFVVAALVRKAGAGMLTMFVFNLLSDQFHYGYGGEPFFFVYEMLTYGLFLDLAIVFTGGNIFGVKGGLGMRNPVMTTTATVTAQQQATTTSFRVSPAALAVIEGAIVGFLFAFPDPLFYTGFIAPFLYGGVVDWSRILFTIVEFIPMDVVVGIIAALAGLRISRAV
ncbi:MAG: hypothetical protein QXI37_04100 [Thermoprotei archaeon]